MARSIDEMTDEIRAAGLPDIAREVELMQEVLAFYANDEERYLRENGEPYGSIPSEVGMKARQHRAAFQRREVTARG